MTRDDFEEIGRLDDVANGGVRIQLRHFGFYVLARRGDYAAEHIISYAEAFAAKYPVELFKTAIELAKKKLTT